jgi:hypothetical protein
MLTKQLEFPLLINKTHINCHKFLACLGPSIDILWRFCVNTIFFFKYRFCYFHFDFQWFLEWRLFQNCCYFYLISAIVSKMEGSFSVQATLHKTEYDTTSMLNIYWTEVSQSRASGKVVQKIFNNFNNKYYFLSGNFQIF